MSSGCDFREMCEVGALFDEAKICAFLSYEAIVELGWESGARVIINAAFDTMSQLTDEQLADFNDQLPQGNSRCDDCLQKRTDTMRALLGPTPDSPHEL